jgi:tripartite-type tricarboxylate transporter receptor subunit TctC
MGQYRAHGRSCVMKTRLRRNAMTIYRRRFLQLAGAAAAGLAAPRLALAETYPTHSVRVIVPFTAGGPTDLFSRLLTGKLSEQMGQRFYVENVGGAGGNIGAGRAAQAAPDGYTIFIDGANYVINQSLFRQVPYDPFKSFDPVTIAVTSPAILTVNPSVPAQTVKELVALIKANPTKYSYASPGTGTPPDLVGELFRLTLKLDLVHVPFKGGGEAITSALGGQTPISFGAIAPSVPHIKAGKLRALAVTGAKRASALPDVPTMAEAGYPEIEGETWFTVLVPTGTAKDIITRLHGEVARALIAPDVKQRLDVLGYEPLSSTPEEATARFKIDAAKWAKVIHDTGMALQ